jgi:hypothetical protein
LSPSLFHGVTRRRLSFLGQRIGATFKGQAVLVVPKSCLETSVSKLSNYAE